MHRGRWILSALFVHASGVCPPINTYRGNGIIRMRHNFSRCCVKVGALNLASETRIQVKEGTCVILGVNMGHRVNILLGSIKSFKAEHGRNGL
jgi:hypothetical protein